MIDSQRRLFCLEFLKSGLDWIQMVPTTMNEWLEPYHFSLLMQAGRDYRFQRFNNMRHLARDARTLFGSTQDAGMALSYEGLAAAQMGDVDVAFDCLKTARDTWPMVAAHYFNCGLLVLRFSNDLESAEFCFMGAIAQSADHPQSWLALTVVRLLMGRDQACVEAARRAMALEASGGGVAELCLATALERLGQPVEWPGPRADGGLAAPSVFGAAPAADRVVLTVALGDGGAEEALRLARSLEDVAPEWGVHVRLCNASPSAVAAVSRWAEERPAHASWSEESLLAATADQVGRRLPLVQLRALAGFARAFGKDVVLAEPRTVFTGDPAALLPSESEGVALTIGEGFCWERVDQDLVALRWGEAAAAFLADAERFSAGPWGSASVAAGVGLWRAWSAHPGAKILAPPALAVARIGPEVSPSPTPETKAEINEIVQSRFGPMLLNKYDLFVSAGVRETGVWSADELDLLQQLIRPGQTVLDVGANMGSHTLAFCNFVGPTGRVHAFEPQRIMFQAMVASVALNSWTNAHCHQNAVGAERGRILVPTIRYDQPSNFGIVSLISDWTGAQSVEILKDEAGEMVEVVTIDGLNLPACHLIKIDVEGMEGDVLLGAAETLRTHRPIVYMECHRTEWGRASLALLKSFGYAVWWHGQFGSQNVVAVPVERPFLALDLEEA